MILVIIFTRTRASATTTVLFFRSFISVDDPALVSRGERMQIITNNPMVKEKIKSCPVEFIDGTYADVFKETKRLVVEERFVILTHPLSGSIKPNETYYKSILITTTQLQQIDMESLDLIDNALDVYEKFNKNRKTPQWTPQILEDFADIDLDLIENALSRIRFSPELRFK